MPNGGNKSKWPIAPADYQTHNTNKQILLAKDHTERIRSYLTNGPNGKNRETVPYGAAIAHLDMLVAVLDQASNQPSNNQLLAATNKLFEPVNRIE